MTLYVKSENYHFEGELSGVIVDEKENKFSLFYKKGIEENNIQIPNNLIWKEIKVFNIDTNGEITIKGIDYSQQQFYCLNKININ